MMKKKVKIFDIVLIVIFTVFSLVMIIPVYKVLVDSFDLKTAYGMKLFPEKFGFAGYKSIFTNPTMLSPISTKAGLHELHTASVSVWCPCGTLRQHFIFCPSTSA